MTGVPDANKGQTRRKLPAAIVGMCLGIAAWIFFAVRLAQNNGLAEFTRSIEDAIIGVVLAAVSLAAFVYGGASIVTRLFAHNYYQSVVATQRKQR